MNGIICCTLDCNLACSYCYEGNGNKFDYPNIKRINEEFDNARSKIEKFIDELYIKNTGAVTKIIWHGGEPTLINCELLDSIMQNQKDKGHDIYWSMQSNGTLITDRYIEVLKKHNVSVGISLDGLKAQHDKYRRMKNGNPTFDIIIKNIKKLQKKNVKCSVLITVTDSNVENLIEIYDYFAILGVNFNFNALFPDFSESRPKLNALDYSNCICNLFDHWISDNTNKIIITPFILIIEGLLKPERGIPACHWVKDCSKSFVAIDNQGDLYPCEHWVGNETYKFGNITNGLASELKKCTFFKNRIDYLSEEDCKQCEIWNFCYGGCPWNGWKIFGDPSKKDASICVGRKRIIYHIRDFLKKNNRI